jgi:hypothetical protein
MYCKRCHSDKQSDFNSEVAIHFSGHEALDKSLVFVFPKLAVCFHCGFTEFTIPARELRVLERGSPVDGAAVLPQRVSQPSETEKRSFSPEVNS